MRHIKELYAYREMILNLVKKDLRGRYKGSILGFFWTFLNPLLQLLVYTLVFSTILKSNIERYYLFLFVALIPWIFFSSTLITGATSVLWGKELVKKIYFPRKVLPISSVTSGFVNMLFCFIIIFIVIFISGNGVNFVALLYLPPVMLVEYIFVLGISMITSACTVYLRDLEYILNIISMAWMYMTPIMYDITIVPEEYQFLFNLNPMTPIIIAYRDILYYKQIPRLQTLAHAFSFGIIVFIIGWILFEHLQKRFVEEM